MNEETNQCDGCARKLPIQEGIHRDKGYDMVMCSKDRYSPQDLEEPSK